MRDKNFKSVSLCGLCAVMSILPCFFMPKAALAQSCTAPYEMVTKLFYPDASSYAYSVWSAMYGKSGRDDIFVSAVPVGEKNVLAVGKRSVMDGGHAALVLVLFDHRGRKIWDRDINISGLLDVVKVLKHGDGYVIAVNRKKDKERGEIWLGFLDKDGTLTGQNNIKDKNFDLSINDIIPTTDSKAWVISVSASTLIGSGDGKQKRQNASVYILDLKGNEKLSRSYIFGLDSEITGLKASKFSDNETGYIATGYFENDFGKRIALVMRLDSQMSLVWQEEFSRGDSAELIRATDGQYGHVYVAGDVVSSRGALRGVWLAALDQDSGALAWQRYYYGESGTHTYGARGVSTNKDGLISVLMMAQVAESKKNIPMSDDELSQPLLDFAHILTLSPRGITLSGDSYFYGEGAFVSELTQGRDGARILSGYTVVPADGVFGESKQQIILKPEIPSPLDEPDKVMLPDAILSDKARKGLALLQKNLKETHGTLKHTEHKELANIVPEVLKGTTINALVIIGEKPDAYSDPCAK